MADTAKSMSRILSGLALILICGAWTASSQVYADQVSQETVWDESGQSLRYADGRPIRITNPDGSVDEYTYYPDDTLEKIVRNGTLLERRFANGKLAFTTDAYGNTVEFWENGSKKTEIFANVNTYAILYWGWADTLIRADYNEYGIVQHQEWGSGKVIDFARNGLPRHEEYDEWVYYQPWGYYWGSVHVVIDRNEAGQTTSETRSDGTTITYTYYDDGSLARKDQNGTPLIINYPNGRVQYERTMEYGYIYSNYGYWYGWGVTTTIYEYDANGRMTYMRKEDSSGYSYTLSQSYYENGQLAEKYENNVRVAAFYPNGQTKFDVRNEYRQNAWGSYGYVNVYTEYDESGRIIRIWTDDNGYNETVVYNPSGTVYSRVVNGVEIEGVYPDGTPRVQHLSEYGQGLYGYCNIDIYRRYDSAGRLTSETRTDVWGYIKTVTNTYWPNGNRRTTTVDGTVTEDYHENGTPVFTSTYEYVNMGGKQGYYNVLRQLNDRGQVTRLSVEDYAEDFEYDTFGNIRTHHIAGVVVENHYDDGRLQFTYVPYQSPYCAYYTWLYFGQSGTFTTFNSDGSFTVEERNSTWWYTTIPPYTSAVKNFNSLGWLTDERTYDGNRYSYRYDRNGSQTGKVFYNAYDNPDHIEHTDGSRSDYVYDNGPWTQGRRVHYATDGTVTTFLEDNERVWTKAYADGHIELYDPEGGYKTEATYPDGTLIKFYPSGVMALKADRAGRSIEFNEDGSAKDPRVGRILSLISSNRLAGGYFSMGQKSVLSQEIPVVQWKPDGLPDVAVEMSYMDGASRRPATVNYHFDGAGAITGFDFVVFDDNGTPLITGGDKGLDNSGQPQYVVTQEMIASGNRSGKITTSVRLSPDGTVRSQNSNTTVREVMDNGDVQNETLITTQTPSSGSTSEGRVVRVDAAGNLLLDTKRVTETTAKGRVNEAVTGLSAEYDDAGRTALCREETRRVNGVIEYQTSDRTAFDSSTGAKISLTSSKLQTGFTADNKRRVYNQSATTDFGPGGPVATRSISTTEFFREDQLLQKWTEKKITAKGQPDQFFTYQAKLTDGVVTSYEGFAITKDAALNVVYVLDDSGNVTSSKIYQRGEDGSSGSLLFTEPGETLDGKILSHFQDYQNSLKMKQAQTLTTDEESGALSDLDGKFSALSGAEAQRTSQYYGTEQPADPKLQQA